MYKNKYSKICMLVIVVLAMLFVTACGKGPGEEGSANGTDAEQYKLKFYWCEADTDMDPYAISAHEFKNRVEEKTDGRVEVLLYPDSQLGSEREAIEGISLGTIDMGVITNAPISGFVPQFQILDLPYLFSDVEQAHSVLDGPIGQDLLKLLGDHGIIGLGFTEGGFRQMINNVRPINTPDDVAGIKFRVMENPVYIGMFEAMGSNPTPMAWGETFTAVQQKTIDGLEIPIPVIHQNKYYEVARYLSLTNHTYSPLVYMISEKTWDTLPVDIQDAVVESAKEAVKAQRIRNGKNIEGLLLDLEEQGMEVNTVENMGLFKEKMASLYEEYEEIVGKDLMDAILEATK